MNWYYADAGQQMGPVDDAGLAALVATGKVTDDTLVWREGMPNWQPYREVRGGGLRINPGPAEPGGSSEEAVCVECGRVFRVEDTIRIGDSRVCASCKPIFVQKMREGVNVGGGSLRYAGFWIRFAAVFLDGLILQAVNVAIRLAFGLGLTTQRGSAEANPMALVAFGLQLLIAVGYESFMVGKYGATLGKMACKIHVVYSDGTAVSYGTAIARYFAKIVSSLVCAIGYIMAAFDGEKRALHDRMCNTRVVYNN